MRPLTNEILIPTNNRTKLAATVFPAKQPVGIVQVIHGALEHQSRYFEFADYLSQHGFVVITSDNRGHGKSVSSDDPLGVMRDWHQLIDDQIRLSRFIRGQFPGLPLFLVGHSFGSILGRLYLQQHDDLLNGLILTGTADYVPFVPVGLFLGQLYQFVHREMAHSKLLSMLSGLPSGNHSWLSYNQENIRSVSKDPLMLDEYPVISLITLWKGDYELKQFDHFHCQSPNLPILSITGDHDKFSGGRRGLADTVYSLNRIGYQNITVRVMPHMKHEVLQETNRNRVYALIEHFLRDHLK